MGIFNTEQTLEQTIEKLWREGEYEFLPLLDNYDFSYYKSVFEDEKLLADIVQKIAQNNLGLEESLSYLERVYKAICITKSKEERLIFEGIIDLYTENSNIFVDSNTFEELLAVFDDKKLVLEYLRNISHKSCIKENENSENIKTLIKYLPKARRYYYDDRALLLSAIDLVSSADVMTVKYGEVEEVEKIVDKRISEDKKANGIYDIDKAVLAELQYLCHESGSSIENLQKTIELSKRYRKLLEEELKRFKSDLTEKKLQAITEFEREITNALNEFNTVYLELQNGQKESVYAEKDSLLLELNAAYTQMKLKLENIAANIGKTANIEVNRVNSIANQSVERVTSVLEDSDNFQKVVQMVKDSDEMTEKIETIRKFNQEDLTRVISQQQSIINTPTVQITNSDKEEYPKRELCYYFDDSIPLKERKQTFKKRKKELEKAGELFHEKFDEIATLLMAGSAVYIYGPSGSGKTFLINQLSRLLGFEYIQETYITQAFNLVGFILASGEFSKSNLYRCYKYGLVLSLEEFDNSVTGETIILNEFLSRSNTQYTFINGETVLRSPNFRIIATGNTNGNGGTLSFNTRKALEPSVQQRFVPVEVGFDYDLIKGILRDYPEWSKFAVLYAQVLNCQTQNSGSDFIPFSARIANEIKYYKDMGVFDGSKEDEDKLIMKYQIVKTTSEDTRTQIISMLEDVYETKFMEKDLLKIYKQIDKEIREEEHAKRKIKV